MDIFVQSFLNSATKLTISVNTTTTFSELAELVYVAEGTTSTIQQFYINNVEIDTSATMAVYNITTGTYIGSSNTISQLSTKELRQKAKLDLASLKRKEIYDINKLPTQYIGNTSTDNVNVYGLEIRRPWVIDYGRVMDGMILWLDASDKDSYVGTGTNWIDLTNPANNGTLIGNITYSASDGGSLVFPNPNTGTGTTSYIRMNRVTEFMPTTGLTVEQWIYPDSWTPATGRQTISNTEAGGYAISLRNNGIDGIVLLNGVYRNARLLDASVLTGWNHIALTCDGRYVKLYVNGIDTLTGNNDAGAVYPITYNPTNGLFIGAEAGASATIPNEIQSYEGKIGTTAIYNRALTSTEILKNYNSDKSRFGL